MPEVLDFGVPKDALHTGPFVDVALKRLDYPKVVRVVDGCTRLKDFLEEG